MLKIISTPLLVVAASFLIISDLSADQSYQVRKGDNLYKIGRLHGVSYQEIMKANRLKNTMIYPGQTLTIPTTRPEPVTNQVPTVVAAPRPTVVPSNNRVNAPAPPVNSTPQSSPIQPNDPIDQPFASATPVAPSKPRTQRSEEDPLGLGYNPTSPYRNGPATTVPHQPYASAQKVPAPRKRIIARNVPRFSRTREVPAVAHYPEGPLRVFELDPKKFPTPSFSNPQRAIGAPAPMKSYTVQSGDSMWKIARKFGVSPIKIRRANNLNLLARVQPGMELRIP